MSTIESFINPDAVNQLVADAILKSAIGTQLKTVIDAEVKKLLGSYNNPIEPIIKNEIANVIRDVVRTDYSKDLEARIKVRMAETLSDTFISKIIDAALKETGLSRGY